MPWSTWFETALMRIADRRSAGSSLVARKLCPVAPFIVASPAYLAEHAARAIPELNGHHCLGYAYRPRQDIWRFATPRRRGGVHADRPATRHQRRCTHPTVLDGIAIAELPESSASEYLADGRRETHP